MRAVCRQIKISIHVSRVIGARVILAGVCDSTAHPSASAQVRPRSRRLCQATWQGGDDPGGDPPRDTRRQGEEGGSAEAAALPSKDREANPAAADAYGPSPARGGGKRRVGHHFLTANHPRTGDTKHDVRREDKTIRVDPRVEIDARLAKGRSSGERPGKSCCDGDPAPTRSPHPEGSLRRRGYLDAG